MGNCIAGTCTLRRSQIRGVSHGVPMLAPGVEALPNPEAPTDHDASLNAGSIHPSPGCVSVNFHFGPGAPELADGTSGMSTGGGA